MPSGFIVYQKRNGREYATFCKAKWTGERKINETENLGLVIDKGKGVFQSRKRGVFTFSVEKGYGTTEETFTSVPRARKRKDVEVLDYGDSFFLDSFLKGTPYYGIIRGILPGKGELVLSIVYYYILSGGAREYMRDWWEGNYACCLFPDAMPYGSKISGLFRELGSPSVQAAFFRKYIMAVLSGPGIHGVLIDSSGMPNAIDMEKTEVSNHNGDINVETRIIYVCERNTGLPLFFRTISGNVIDVSTIAVTIDDLEKVGVCTDFAILDAGYYSDENIALMYDKGISFITRLKKNRRLYKEIFATHGKNLERSENLHVFNGRPLYVEKVECTVSGHRGFAYLAKDTMMAALEMRDSLSAALEKNPGVKELDEIKESCGVFMLISSEDLDPKEVLPLYYTRQQIEQVFDTSKNYADLLQMGLHSEGTFEGHVFVSFLATIVCHLLQKLFKDSRLNQEEALRILRNHKCTFYDNGDIVPREAKRKQNDCYKLAKVKPTAWKMEKAPNIWLEK